MSKVEKIALRDFLGGGWVGGGRGGNTIPRRSTMSLKEVKWPQGLFH